MFEIKVSSLEGSEKLVKEGWPTKIISLLGNEINLYGDHHLLVVFDDIARPIRGWVHPTVEHLATILEFSATFTDDDRVLIHCMAGISRSTAIAIAICIQHGMTYSDAYAHVRTIRPILSPNKLIMQMVDTHFGLADDLIRLVRTKHRDYTHASSMAEVVPDPVVYEWNEDKK